MADFWVNNNHPTRLQACFDLKFSSNLPPGESRGEAGADVHRDSNGPAHLVVFHFKAKLTFYPLAAAPCSTFAKIKKTAQSPKQ
jgi:hypothetical protein